MALRCISKQPEALMCRTIEHLATLRHRTMAPLIETYRSPEGVMPLQWIRLGRVRHSLPANGRCIHAKNSLLVLTANIKVWNRKE